MDKITVFMYFMTYSFIGWFLETIYCSFLERKFVYRGFLNGPICPIYGFGALFVLFTLEKFYKMPLLVFILGLLLASLLEYISSYLLEEFFNMKWWDYSNKKFNINGRVCLWNSSLFGILSLVLVYIVHPRVSNFIGKISLNIINPLASGLFVAIALDTIVTVSELLNLKPTISKLEGKLEEFEAELETRFQEIKSQGDAKTYHRDTYRTYLKNQREAIKASIDSRIEDKLNNLKIGFSTRRILKSYPSLRSRKNPKSIYRLKEKVNKRKNK